MKQKLKLAFFTDHEWSLGRLVTDLQKYIWQYDIDIQLFTWRLVRDVNTYRQISHSIDYFVSNTGGTSILHHQCGIPLDRCIEILYHKSDLEKLILNFTSEDIAKLAGLATVSKDIVRDVEQIPDKIPRKIKFLKMGWNSNTFYNVPSKELKTIGFGSGYHSRQETEEALTWGIKEPRAFKRGYLVSELAEATGLNFSIAQRYTTTMLTMPSWYTTIDAIICPSSDQGAGGPIIEGGLAGRLAIATDVGDFKEGITEKGADAVPVTEKEFMEKSIELLNYYKANPSKYRQRCFEIREYAIKTYDWNNCISYWVDLFTKR